MQSKANKILQLHLKLINNYDYHNFKRTMENIDQESHGF